MGVSSEMKDAATSKKRQRDIKDYFSTSNPSSPSSPPEEKFQRRRLNDAARGATQIGTATVLISGLTVLDGFVTEREEQDLVQFLDRQQWRTDLSRRVIHYGGTYCLMPPRDATPEQRKQIESTVYQADAIPENLDFVITRMTECDIFSATQRPEYCIVNSYTSNQGISAHVENFRFASPVCGLTLLSGDWMRFHELKYPDDGSVRSGKAAKAERTGRKLDVWMPPRSLLVMRGDARERWQHEIVRSRKDRATQSWRRVSVTFRTLKSQSSKS